MTTRVSNEKQGESLRSTSVRSRKIVFASVMLAIALMLLLTTGGGRHSPAWLRYLQGLISSDTPAGKGTVEQPTQSSSEVKELADVGQRASRFIRMPIPKHTSNAIDLSMVLAQLPPPPLPMLKPDATQAERRKSFGLIQSVDHIVRDDETFEVDGRTWSIGEIQQHLPGFRAKSARPTDGEKRPGGTPGPAAIPSAGASPDAYYGVRTVRPGENIWFIHYGVIREYFARRGLRLDTDADRPLSNGRSSGVGRLLKFMEGIVFVYNLEKNQLETNLDRIPAYTIIVFFKITDLFSALNQLKAEDLQCLRLTGGCLRIERPGQEQPLVDRSVFVQ